MFDRILRAVARAAIETVVDEMKKAQRTGPSERERQPPHPRHQQQDHKRSRDDAGFRPGMKGSHGRSWAPPPSVREEITVVLRRQVPPRDAPPRSWIGGLPMLPDTIEWPRARNSEYRGAGEIPLNFAAQIACADLPKELWGGLGPREGWLLFFLATWGCVSFEDEGSIRVFHTRELGRERHPPVDKRSVGDPEYSGGDNPALNYARWPVDIVAFANRPDFPNAKPWTGDEPVSPIPPGFEGLLYDGAPVAASLWQPREDPFTWGAVAMMLERTLAERARYPDRARAVARLPVDGRDKALAAIAEEEAKVADTRSRTPDPELQEQRERQLAERRAKLAQQRAFLGQAGDPFDPETLAALVEESQAERRRWMTQQEGVMAELLAEARSHGPRIWLSPADRSRIADDLSAANSQWHISTVAPGNRVPCPEFTTVQLKDLVERERSRCVAIAARDLYSAGPQERASLPDDMRLALEADLRRLEYNRPHRLGGIHQPVQDTIAPNGKVLLLQLGADEPTGFSWGDSGAMFAWIGIDALSRGDFSDIQWWTENM